MTGKTKNVMVLIAICVGAVALGQSTFAQTGTMYDEAVDGDLSNGLIGTNIPLVSGLGTAISNTVTGVVGGPAPPAVGDPIDNMSFTLAAGCTLEIFLDDYVPANGSDTSGFFILDENGNIINPDGNGIALSTDSIGSELLATAGLDLGEGEYTAQVAFLEFTPGQQYDLDFQCTCPVPEPNSFALLGFALLAFVSTYRKNS